MPHSNFAVFGGWYFFQYCSQKAENCTNCPTLTALSTFAFNSYTAISRKVVGKKCTRQSRKVLWVVLSLLFFKEIWKNGTRGHGHKFASAKEKNNKSRLDSYCRPEQCIGHIPYCHSGLSRAHFFPTTFLESLYTATASMS